MLYIIFCVIVWVIEIYIKKLYIFFYSVERENIFEEPIKIGLNNKKEVYFLPIIRNKQSKVGKRLKSALSACINLSQTFRANKKSQQILMN